MASYAEPSDLIARFDARTIGNLVSDNGVSVALPALTTDTKVLAALADASGEIDAALMHGQRYSAADLAALTGNSLAYLKNICCKIAMAHLWQRRPYLDDERAERDVNAAQKALDRLRKGENVFAITDQLAAGTPDLVSQTVSSVAVMNLTVDRMRGRNGFYPPRQLPLN